MAHFLCGVERAKRFVNIHLHCIVTRQQPEKDEQKRRLCARLEKFLRTPVLQIDPPQYASAILIPNW